MNPWPPHVANTIAFDYAKRLLESSPLGLSMTLFWHEQEWECQFLTDNHREYWARHPDIANAILDAAEQVPE